MWNHYRNKYSANKVVYDGIEFASKREARRYQDLILLAKAGEITDLQMQVKYQLIPAQREPDTIGPKGGKRAGKVIEHELSYVADFVYRDREGNVIVEDTKGFRTKEYIIKRKLMLWVHGIRIREV